MNYIELITGWAKERNLLDASPTKQSIKLFEEYGELCQGIAKNRPEQVKDSIGDIVVVLTILAAQVNHPLPDLDTIVGQEALRGDLVDLPLDALVVSLAGPLFMVSAASTFEELNAELKDFPTYMADIFAILRRITALHGLYTVQDAVAEAWSEIKDRTGSTVNGVFIKDADMEA